MKIEVKEQAIVTMVREKHNLHHEIYNSIRHVEGVGKRSEYTESGLVALVKQIALDRNSLDPPPKEMQKIVGPTKHTNKKVSKYSSQRSQVTNKSTAALTQPIS